MFASALKASFEGRRAWALIAVLWGVFLALGLLLRYSFLQTLDLRFTRELQEVRYGPWDSLMLAVTFCGNAYTVLTLNLLGSAFLLSQGRRKAALMLFASLLGMPVDWLLKSIWERARPAKTLVTVHIHETGYSFPSGHAVLSTCFYGTVAALTWILLPESAWRKPLTVVFAVMPVLIDISRVYLGVHWLSDVAGGTAVGLALLLTSVKLYTDAERIKAAAAPASTAG